VVVRILLIQFNHKNGSAQELGLLLDEFLMGIACRHQFFRKIPFNNLKPLLNCFSIV